MDPELVTKRQAEASGTQVLQLLQELHTETHNFKAEIAELRSRGRGRGRSDNRPQLSRTEDGKPICFWCGKAGHIARSCPEKSPTRSPGLSPPPVPAATLTIGVLRPLAAASSPEEVPLLYINFQQLITEEVTCNGIPFSAIIDTGAAVSVMSPLVLTRLGLPLQAYNGPSVLKVNGQKAPFWGLLMLRFSSLDNVLLERCTSLTWTVFPCYWVTTFFANSEAWKSITGVTGRNSCFTSYPSVCWGKSSLAGPHIGHYIESLPTSEFPLSCRGRVPCRPGTFVRRLASGSFSSIGGFPWIIYRKCPPQWTFPH